MILKMKLANISKILRAVLESCTCITYYDTQGSQLVNIDQNIFNHLL